MASNTNQTISLTVGSNNEHHETNYSTNEDIFTKQQKLKVIVLSVVYYETLFYRKKQKLLLHLVQKWLGCKLKLNG
jgi:hypothetical protein